MNEQEVKTVRRTCGTVCSVCLTVVMGALLLALFLVSQGHLKADDLLLVLKGLQASPYNPLAIAVPMLEVRPIPRPAPSRAQHRAGWAQHHVHAKSGCPARKAAPLTHYYCVLPPPRAWKGLPPSAVSAPCALLNCSAQTRSAR
jgi:hypothetical protein